jgi:nitroreductase
VRHFSSKEVPIEVINEAILAAGSAPNGANKQPWHFAVIKNPAIKKKIREAAEAEEFAFYNGRANDEWLEDLRALGTDASKPFLEEAPYLIAIFAQTFGLNEEGERTQHYYVKESVGIATGFLIAALHDAGLATLTHTPTPMGFLNEILERPRNEKAYILLVCGLPAEDAEVPKITKKSLSEISSVH